MTGLIFAMKEEISSIKKLTTNISVFESCFFKYFVFSFNNKEFVATFSGIGKANAAACCLDMIKTFSVKNIINIGSCGSCDVNLNIFDVVVVDKNYYLDVDATAFGYEHGQVPQEKPFFENNNSLNNKVKKILNENNIDFKSLNAGTSDSFIDHSNFKKINKLLFKKISCIDMESAAINQIASKNKTNCCFIKIISDSLYNSKKSTEEFNKNIKKIGKISQNITKILLEKL